MLKAPRTIDDRQLQPWQLDEAQAIYRDFQDRSFQSFHHCAVDLARIEPDERIITDLPTLPAEAQTTITQLHTLLATDLPIHGANDPDAR